MDREAWRAAIHGVPKTRILKWFAIPFSSGTYPVRTLHITHLSLGALHDMPHHFIALGKAVIQVIILLQFSSVVQSCLILVTS